MPKPAKQYINILLRPYKNPSSFIWVVKSISKGNELGEIKWYGAWRQYCFYPADNCIFNKTCMNHIIDHIEREMAKRRKQ